MVLRLFESGSAPSSSRHEKMQIGIHWVGFQTLGKQVQSFGKLAAFNRRLCSLQLGSRILKCGRSRSAEADADRKQQCRQSTLTKAHRLSR
jgi:hypothetical protein